MALLEVRGLVVKHGQVRILDRVELEIQHQEKVGLIGANGAGKTTLVRAIAGLLPPDEGVVRLESPTRNRVVYVPQHFPESASGTTLEFLIAHKLAERTRLRVLEEHMADAGEADLEAILEEYARVREHYDADGGDEAEQTAASLLSRFGLDYLARTEVGLLSGGEKNRIQIARALFARPDLLILDEPGNHLDAWGLAWLEDLLSTYPAAVLVISHNRYMLDRVVGRILELKERRVTAYSGSYSDYRRRTLADAVSAARDAKADAQHLARLEAMVSYLAQLARSRADTGIGKRLRARRTQLEKAREEARTAPKLGGERPEIRFSDESNKADIAIDIRDFCFAYGDRTLFTGASALIRVGERVALVGKNGSGKTTLLRQIVGEASWDNRRLRLGPSMKIGYCAQDQAVFDASKSVEENLRSLAGISRDRVFTLIHRYLFDYRDLDRDVATLSGGELNRLQLARAELLGANFLILDEPTNHLDIPSREAVEEALIEFPGTILVVSHDRYLLDSVVRRVLFLEDGVLQDFDGGFSDFWYSYGRYVEESEPDDPELVRMERRLDAAYRSGRLQEAANISKQMEKRRRMATHRRAE